ncbi:hypothetical protein EMIHUDRAFT_360287 [Emiliania huxleyi CCMP1516]|uniref:Auto-transporter adhesin head GIN domain-containing protein n=2 Tax=Emiliania huxleyi TaxID=2903 RepID=A0A0D3HZA7_EMIH1|nr:hypothetical protein EMIHUDRAFT_360287 [Emiliania huxleyi CCMP1516]EOD04342.1 hypothetical protein EMIHUDRAFT_360287 [Emiliania huxleyi CCMP1516]|mmetsp:Transcript_2522/g.7501  ORF Transcript_2522/g.7501 Transcript_2522/m.7501 type:complete len:216 (+) Transcript_2522:65-712(+)|eukprot:XP_005756771.1 hypothetical protein EMIHUDRAFT_360287 [Emiliania huxleyi CCMP1516]
MPFRSRAMLVFALLKLSSQANAKQDADELTESDYSSDSESDLSQRPTASKEDATAEEDAAKTEEAAGAQTEEIADAKTEKSAAAKTEVASAAPLQHRGFAGSFIIGSSTKVYLNLVKMSGGIRVSGGTVLIDIHASSGVSISGTRQYSMAHSADSVGHIFLEDTRFGSLKRTEVTEVSYFPDTDSVRIRAVWRSRFLQVPVEVLLERASDPVLAS